MWPAKGENILGGKNQLTVLFKKLPASGPRSERTHVCTRPFSECASGCEVQPSAVGDQLASPPGVDIPVEDTDEPKEMRHTDNKTSASDIYYTGKPAGPRGRRAREPGQGRAWKGLSEEERLRSRDPNELGAAAVGRARQEDSGTGAITARGGNGLAAVLPGRSPLQLGREVAEGQTSPGGRGWKLRASQASVRGLDLVVEMRVLWKVWSGRMRYLTCVFKRRHGGDGFLWDRRGNRGRSHCGGCWEGKRAPWRRSGRGEGTPA